MKKVLIVTYYFPPAGGPGVQRWLKFVKYLPEFGIEPIVYIPENPTYPIVDEKLLEEIPSSLQIIRKKINEPYRLAAVFSKGKTKKISSGIIPHHKKQNVLDRLLLWVRGNLFVPDARVLWVKPSAAFLKQYLEDNQIDTIITSGPPHSLHLIGLQLKQQTGLRWIADFRDPWTTIGYHKALKLTQHNAHRHKALEQQVLNAADVVLVTSPGTKAAFEAITGKPIAVITNGYDGETATRPALDAKFTLAHIGSFLSGRNPRILWQALADLCNENPDFARALEIKLIGTVSPEIVASVNAFGLSAQLNLVGYLPHDAAIGQQRSAQVLLLIEIDSPSTRCIIPGKIFEYMVSERPIVGIGPKQADFAEILTQTNTGTFFTYGELEGLKAQLRKLYAQYKEGTLKSHPVGLEQYSRRNLTARLADILKQ